MFLIYSLIRRGRVGRDDGWGGALDRAITPQGESRLAGSTSSVVEAASLGFVGKYAGPLLLIVVVGALPLIVQGYWVGLVRAGLRLRRHLPVLDHRHRRGRHALALPDHLRRGGGADHGPAGQQPRLAGPGRRRSSAASIAVAMGVVVGFLSIRLGDLYVALVTLTFGLLMENLVFTLPSFVNQGLGLTLNRPGFATSDRAFAYLCLVVFVDHRPLHRQLPTIDHRPGAQRGALERGRREDVGHQRRADEGHRRRARRPDRRDRRGSARPGADDLPAERVRHLRRRRLAGRAGDDRACARTPRRSSPGSRSSSPPRSLQYYFSTVDLLPNLLPVLFGLGAISAAKYPDGVLAENSRQLRRVVLRLSARRGRRSCRGRRRHRRGRARRSRAAPLVAEQVS